MAIDAKGEKSGRVGGRRPFGRNELVVSVLKILRLPVRSRGSGNAEAAAVVLLGLAQGVDYPSKGRFDFPLKEVFCDLFSHKTIRLAQSLLVALHVGAFGPQSNGCAADNIIYNNKSETLQDAVNSVNINSLTISHHWPLSCRGEVRAAGGRPSQSLQASGWS